MPWNHCILYAAGLHVVFAYDDISRNKIATQSKTYADNIDTKKYDAYNAVDGNTETCTRTQVIGTSSPDKTMWWKVDFGGVFNIYRINILFKKYDESVESRQRGRFAGFSLFVSKTGDLQGATLCYKDGPQLPSLNITCICTESARYVIFYNERLEGVIYPNGYEVTSVFIELCEVTVQGCNNASFYGKNCDMPCPTNCKDNTCHIQSGACLTCKTGWTGMYCHTRCKEGWHGMNCSQQCVGHCRDGTYCNHVTGQCDQGCDAGWTGYMCDKECYDGTYGLGCVNNCSGHCLDDSPCNKRTGHCARGCNPGYTESYCSKECSPGRFGFYCSQHCKGYCINNERCDHVSGVCSNGCQDGFIGKQCFNACKEGYFGTNCSRVCSPKCKPDTCQHTDGSCSCTAGWMGYNCTTECIFSFGENCQYTCNKHCINQTCDRINGSCLYGCKYGDQCDEVYFLDSVKHTISFSSSKILPVTIGGLVCACVLIIVGVVIAVFVIRQKSPGTMCNTGVLKLCWRSSPAAEENIRNVDLSNYQELNFSLQENPYQCISR